MTVDLKLDKKVGEVVSAAILTMLTTEVRDKLIADAIAHLLTPSKDRYGNREESPIEEAFKSALKRIAQQVVNEYVESNTELRATVTDGVHKALTEAVATQHVRVDVCIGER